MTGQGDGREQETCASCGFRERHQIHGHNPFGAGHTFSPAPQQPPAQEREECVGLPGGYCPGARCFPACVRESAPPSEADSAGEAELDGYGHTEADHEAAGACRRPSMQARVAAAPFTSLGTDWQRAFKVGYDAALAASPGVQGGDGEARERLAAVLALHQSLGAQNVWCGYDGEHWPCATVRAAGGSR